MAMAIGNHGRNFCSLQQSTTVLVLHNEGKPILKSVVQQKIYLACLLEVAKLRIAANYQITRRLSPTHREYCTDWVPRSRGLYDIQYHVMW